MITDSSTDHNSLDSIALGERFRPEPSIESLIAQMGERQARNLRVRGWNPGLGSSFSLEI